MTIQSARILVVDDDPENRNAVAALLEAFGYRVITAEDGSDALRRMADAPLPDVVVLDLSMPVMRGDECARRMASDPRLSRVGVVFCSAEEFPPCNDRPFVAKPMDPGLLLEAIAHVVAESRDEEPLASAG